MPQSRFLSDIIDARRVAILTAIDWACIDSNHRDIWRRQAQTAIAGLRADAEMFLGAERDRVLDLALTLETALLRKAARKLPWRFDVRIIDTATPAIDRIRDLVAARGLS